MRNTQEAKTMLDKVVKLARENMDANLGGPFGAVITKNGAIIGEGANLVTSTPDPTAHAEIMAIRSACSYLQHFDLSGCELWASCEPCPMCLSAAYWARIDRVYYAASRHDAAEAGFDDQFIYDEICRPVNERQLPTVRKYREEALELLREWRKKEDKIQY